MAEIPLVADVREERGSRASRRLLHSGRIPGVVYGHGLAPVAVAMDARSLRSALSTDAGVNALLDLDIAGAHHLAIARELQRHPVRQTVLHVDFQVVRRDEVVTADVAVNLVGEPLGVTRAGGTVEHLVLSVPIKAKPADIPTQLEYDVSELTIGDTVHLRDLVLPSGVTVEADLETAVVVAHPPKGLVEEEAEAEAAPGEAAPES
ncbi:MAG: ribosomal protein Ctc-form [Acidimicrobiaceae bacterium]|jgi:large subunit ribosomal protein L25|nr:ribosomal protein Ctc-form [Acidimicrobiaceae bacterium]